MDALFALNKGAFKTTTNHIALYRKELSPEYQSVADDALSAAGASSSGFQSWNIPEFSSLLGKSVPVDVHGKHILVDEDAVRHSGLSTSVVRYYIIAGALRSQSGGRRWYDIKTLNSCMAVGAAAGAGFLYLGKRRWKWMMTRPYLRVFASAMVCVSTTYALRIGIRSLGMGTFAAQKNFTKAIDLVKCGECLEEIRQFTDKQIESVSTYVPPKLPNGDEIPAEVQEVIRRGNEAHSIMLGMNARTMKVAATKYKDQQCRFHDHGSTGGAAKPSS